VLPFGEVAYDMIRLETTNPVNIDQANLKTHSHAIFVFTGEYLLSDFSQKYYFPIRFSNIINYFLRKLSYLSF